MSPNITIIMPVKNEIKYLSIIEEIFFKELKFVSDIIVMDDNSTDGSFEYLKKIESLNGNLKVYRNYKKLSLNGIIYFLLKKVKTNYVHIRSPHDIYYKEFYAHHHQTFSRFLNIEASINRVSVLSKITKKKRLEVTFYPWLSSFYSRLLDLNYSSCGFVCNTNYLRELWLQSMEFDNYCDWLVKKDIIYNQKHVLTFKILSSYNDLIKSNPDQNRLINKKRLLDHIIKNFWDDKYPFGCFIFPLVEFEKQFFKQIFQNKKSLFILVAIIEWLFINFLKNYIKHMKRLILLFVNGCFLKK